MRSLALLIVLNLAACVGAPDPLEYERAPADFTLDITVQGPAEPTLPRAQRPARYIVEPDGVLRVGVGEGVSEDYYPPQTRQLTHNNVDRLWRLIRDSSILAPDNPDRIRPGRPLGMAQPRPAAQIIVTFGGTTNYFRVLLDGETPGSESGLRLIDHLAGLAWIEQ
jgi:hypothetical protein